MNIFKILLIPLLVILPLSSAHAQDVQEDINKAIADWYSKTGPLRPVTWNITQFGQASPSKEFIDKYNPKQTYCIKCKITLMLRRVRVTPRYGGPPLREEVTPLQAATRSDNHIAIITQSGEIELINIGTMAGDPMPPPPMFPGEPQFHSLWQENCPFPME